MSHRLPGGSGGRFWERLIAGEDLVTEVEEGRWAKSKFLHPRKSEPASSYTFAAGSVSDVWKFDAGFFGISPREAAQMDPQQRLLMHLAWEALEDAGIQASKLKGSNCGVYVGISSFDYAHRLADDPAAIDSKTPTGNAGSIAANRISYFLDTRGPSMPIDTACSSSLVAFHQAWNAMMIGDCSMAIVGGVSLHFHPLGFISFTKTGMLSRDGRCRTFDASADGYVRSEGGGVVILKPLDAALADGDRILAVVEGSGINCDGKTNGITVPSGEAQAALLKEVYGNFGISPSRLDFLEAHGTGTAVGDPIETWAIGNILGKFRDDPLPIGSVKSNLGHLEAASGMAGLVKVLLMFRHRTIPPNLHFREPNPRIDFDDLNLRVVTGAESLPSDRQVFAGINSFGFGGANAHLVLSAPPLRTAARKSPPKLRSSLPFILSAKTPKALREQAGHLADFLGSNSETPLYDLAYALCKRRDWLMRRAVCHAKDRSELTESLRAFAAGNASSIIEADALPSGQKPVFVFTGNGGQWAGMGRALFAGNEIFRKAVLEVDSIFADYASFRLQPHFEGTESSDLARTELAQPLVFAIQVGLVRALEAAGFSPSGVIGHSLGEVAAAWAAGSLALEQAVRIIRLRSKHQQTTQGFGGMAAIAASRAEVESILVDPAMDGIDVVVSGENSPRSTTVAGTMEGLAALQAVLQPRGTGFKPLDLPYPFHSPAMDSVVQGFSEEIGEISALPPSIALYSTVMGRPLTSAPTGEYWAENILKPVLFREAVESAAANGARIFIEIGPHPVLTNHVLHTLQAKRIDVHASGICAKDKAAPADLHDAVWRLALGGVDYDWARLFNRKPHHTIDLPSYPWQMEEFLLPSTTEGGGLISNDKEHPLLGYRAHAKDWEWENHLDTVGMPWLADHRVGGSAVFPAAGFIEMALAAASLRHPGQTIQLEDFEIRTPLVLDSKHSKTVRLTLEENGGHFVIKSRDRLSEDQWQPHAMGRIASQSSRFQPEPPSRIKKPEESITAKEIYAAARMLGLEYGPAFQSLKSVSGNSGQLDATLILPEPVEINSERFLLHPTLLDGAFHSLFALMRRHDTDSAPQAFLPVRTDRFVLIQPGIRPVEVRAILRSHNKRSLLADFHLLDESGALVARSTGWRFRSVQLVRRSFDRAQILRQEWIHRPRPSKASALAAIEKEITEILGSVCSMGAKNSLLERYPVEGDSLLDAMCSSFVLEAFSDLTDSQGVLSLKELLASGKVSAGMEHYFQRLARLLVQDGLASEGPGTGEWIISERADEPSGQAIWQSLVVDFPEKAIRFSTVGRVGLHLHEILDGSRRLEEFLPKSSQLASSTFYFAKSAMKAESQEILLQAIDKLREKLPSAVGRVLWVCGPRPAEEKFVSPWMRECPGLISILLPDTSESADVEELLASYPGIETAKGSVSEDILSSLADGRKGFDIIVAPPNLSTEDYGLFHSKLLPGGLFLCCLPEKSRFEDLVPVGGEAGLFSAENTMDAATRSFRKFQRLSLSQIGDSGPALFVGFKEGVPENRPEVEPQTLVVSLDTGCESLSDSLISSLSAKGTCHLELLPPSDSEAASVWERLIAEHQPDYIVFVAAGPVKGQTDPAIQVARELCAISSCLRAAAKIFPRTVVHIATQGVFSGQPNRHWIRSALWGFARVARNEFSELRIRCIDFSLPLAAAELPNNLAEEIVLGGLEDEVLLDGNCRLVRRVVAGLESSSGKNSENQRMVLDFDTPGPFQNLRWKRTDTPHPGPGQVAIIPKAGGLNFRDVMYAMGLLPDEALEGGFAGQTLGMELSGTIAAVGEEVEGFQVGDEVIAFAPSSFSSWTVTSSSAVVQKPSGLSFAAAATIPAAFYTAYHALVELGGLKPGERVLIHGAAGGVGIAAIQIARHIGAEVFATAGNDDKRDFVRLLGADHVFNSRSLDFADAIMCETQGEGVDVVLNSLAGEAVSKNLEILRPFGRLLELGKRDFYENNRIGLRPFRHNIRYFAVDADQIMALRPDMAARGFRELLELFKNRSLSPLPMTVFPAAEAAGAFRFMQHSSQTGKVVLDLTDIPSGGSIPRVSPESSPVRAHGTYLVTGGWSGFGLETARWLLSQGARSLAILGRRGPTGEDAERFREECQALGANIFCEPCDVTNRLALSSALEKIRRTMAPLSGVFHAATVIEDALIVNLDVSKAVAVLAPKITAAALLDELTRKDPLDHFVLYSSATTFFGNPGQAAYVAANTALEELSASRRQAGKPSTCISWGPIGDTGYLSRHVQIKDALVARTGGQPLESADALKFLGQTLTNGISQVAWLDMEWGAMSRFLSSSTGPRFSMLRHLRSSSNAAGEGSTDLRRELELLEPAELLETLKGLLKEEIGNILRVAPDKLDENRSLLEVGMDSLMGVELMSSLENNLGISIPIMALSEGPTISRLAERLSHSVRPPTDAEEAVDSSAITNQMRHLVAQHAAEISQNEIEELVAEIKEGQDK